MKTITVKKEVKDIAELMAALRSAKFLVLNVGAPKKGETIVWLDDSETKDPSDLIAAWPNLIQANYARAMTDEEILDRMDKVEGWFEREEGRLLLNSCKTAIGKTSSKTIVEIGSFKGRSTTILGEVAKQTGAHVFAVDPHEGLVLGENEAPVQFPSSLEAFQKTMTDAGLLGVVTGIRAKASEIKWDRKVAFLFDDGHHDYENASGDIRKFSPWIEIGGIVAFHDYREGYPGVRKAIDEAKASRRFLEVARALSLVVMEKVA